MGGGQPPTVVNYRVVTDAPAPHVAALLGMAWTSSWLRSRLGRITEPTRGRYRLRHLGNHVEVTVDEGESLTELRAIVTRAHDTRTQLPGLARALDVNRLTRGLITGHLLPGLKDGGHRVGVRTRDAPHPTSGADTP